MFLTAAFRTTSRNCPNHVLALIVEPNRWRIAKNIDSTINRRWYVL